MATEDIKTIRASGNGGDYISLSTWQAGEQRDLTILDEIAVAECFDDWGETGLNDPVILAGWTTTATNRLVVRTQPDQRATGLIEPGAPGFTGFSLQGAVGASLLRTDQGYTDIIGISGKNDTTAGGSTVIRVVNVPNCLVDSCFIWREGNRAKLDLRGPAPPNQTIVRNLLHVSSYGGIYCDTGSSADDGIQFENCTLIAATNTGTAFQLASTGKRVKYTNVVVDGHSSFTNATGSYTAGSTNNASDLAATETPPGDNPILTPIVDGDFEDFASGDYRPAEGGTLDGAGADLSADFTNDYTGQTRTQWDVGAYGIITAGGVTFDGPDVGDMNGTENVDFGSQPGDMSSRFTGATTYALAPDSGPLPTGLSVNATTGNIEGTPTESGTFPNIIVRGSE